MHTPAEVPEFSLQDCSVLEQLLLSIAGTTASFTHIASLISSITSAGFRCLTLKLRTTVQREPYTVQTDLADRISNLDIHLSHLGCLALARNHRVSVVLLGQDPEFLAQGLVKFHTVGYIWAGEDFGEGYLWTFTSPKSSKMKRHCICILDRLFR